MSFQDPNAFYEETILLLDKSQSVPTTITDGQVVNGDLTPFRHRIEVVNTGNQLQNNGVITLRIPPDGTFVRKEPILVDETAKDDYIIQVQIKQDKDKDGVFEEEGKLFRFTIGQPSIVDDEHAGETLKITLIPLEYRARETLDAELQRFTTPKASFERRALAYNQNKGVDNPAFLFTTGPTGSINLSDAEPLKQEWRPLAPTPIHDLFREIIDRQSLPGVGGGVFEDFFFDYEANPLTTKIIDLKAEAVGTTDRGVVIDPLLFETAETEKDKVINVDLIKFKNNVILEASPLGGSLPMEKSRFASAFEHGKVRGEYDVTEQYFDGVSTPDTSQSLIKFSDPILGLRFFTCVADTIGVSPIDFGQTVWDEDFVTIPAFSQFAEFKTDDIITTVDAGFYRFWKATPTSGDTIPAGGLAPTPSNPNWLDIGNRDFPFARRETFFSYTPWTADFPAMRNSLFGVRSGSFTETELTNIGYSAVVPDYNFIRANFDRVISDDRFEQVTFKDVIKRLNSPSEISIGERHLGARYLINGSGLGFFIGHNNQIAEYVGANFKSGSIFESDFRFSNSPVDGDMITDQDTASIYNFNGTVWQKQIDIVTDPIRAPRVIHDSEVPSPLHICKEIKLVEGSSGIPAQAFELSFDWIPFGESRNLTSRGAWWFMQFPIPKIETFGREIGDVVKNPTLDTNNLDFDRKGNTGWNNGLDSEDLGRIQRASFKVRLSLIGTSLGGTVQLAIGYADMPMRAWSVDLFDRIWFADFKARRNGEYSLVKLSFAEGGSRQLHYGRVDELLTLFGLPINSDFFLREKEFTGIEFDFRFVKSFGMFYTAGYGAQGQYFASSLFNFAQDFAGQVATQLFHQAVSTLSFTEIPLESAIIVQAKLAIDEFNFEKQLYTNSDDVSVPDARTVLDHLLQENDYQNAKIRAIGSRERKKFVNQAWFMKAHGDVRMRFGEKFTVTGPRVPTGIQDLVCNEVKHIIDSDGYFIEFTGVRKFVF